MTGRFHDLIARHPSLGALEDRLEAAFGLLAAAYRVDGTVLVCGNGGSAADAEHIVAELMKSMARRRAVPEAARSAVVEASPPASTADAAYVAEHLEGGLRAISLVSQTSLLSAVANDTGPEMGFAQQAYGYGREGDVLWAISTSGRARNVVYAALAARGSGLKVLALTGSDGGDLAPLADAWIGVPAVDVARVQELHRPVYHALCAALEDEFFGPGPD